jgi:hypothetical protein
MPTPQVYPSTRPLVLETPSEGGSVTDFIPTEVQTTIDALAAAGLYLDGPTVSAPDKLVLVDRTTGSQLRLTDAVAQQTLGNLVGSNISGYNPHDGLPDFSHLSAAGPGAGFASGSYLVQATSGPLVTNKTWYTSSAQTVMIFQQAFAYNGPLIATLTSTTYVAGVAARTFKDTYTYGTSPIPTAITRTWT